MIAIGDGGQKEIPQDHYHLTVFMTDDGTEEICVQRKDYTGKFYFYVLQTYDERNPNHMKHGDGLLKELSQSTKAK